jgi:tetratricopeptide (TPR) repeat protein
VSARLHALVGAVALTLTGCASTLDQAREADEQGEGARAELLYRQAMKEPKHAKTARAELVEVFVEAAREVEKKDPVRAEKSYRSALQLDPTHDGALTGLTRLLMDMRRHDDALEIVEAGNATGRCAACGRLTAVVLLRRAEVRLGQKRWTAAREDFERALEVMPDSRTALAIVKTHAAVGNEQPAAEALARAAKLVREGDTDALRQFNDLRGQLVIGSVRDGKLEVTDRLLGLKAPGVDAATQHGLHVAAAVELRRLGAEEAAVRRLEIALTFGKKGGAPLDARVRSEVVRHLVEIYSVRGADSLRRGDAVAADKALARALELTPKNWTLRLQRVLAVAAQAKVEAALEALAHVPRGTKGRSEVEAILESLHVNELLARDDEGGARRALERAKAANPDLPEVHVAMAQILALSQVEDLTRGQMKDLGRRGLVDYPGGRINRYGEALSELDWARKQALGLGRRYPYRGPATEQIMTRLEQQILAFFPKVEFHGQPTTILKLGNTASSSLDVEISGPEGFEEFVLIPSGETRTVTVPEPGFVRLRIGRRRFSLAAEPYTRLGFDLARY